MSSVQVKNVDDATHELLRQRAAAAGMTLGDYVLELIRKDLRKPSRAEWLARVRARPPANVDHGDVIRSIDEGRAERDQKMDRILRDRDR